MNLFGSTSIYGPVNELLLRANTMKLKALIKLWYIIISSISHIQKVKATT